MSVYIFMNHKVGVGLLVVADSIENANLYLSRWCQKNGHTPAGMSLAGKLPCHEGSGFTLCL